MTVQIELAKAKSVIQGVDIPQIPTDLLALKKELESPLTNIATVISIIEKNTMLSGELLKILDSNYFKSPQKILTIKSAVEFIGLEKLYSLLVTATLKNIFKGSGLLSDMVDHSVDVAFSMADILENAYIEGVDRDDAYLLGLFHNIGAIVLASMNETRYLPLYESAMTNPVTVIKKEKCAYGTDHCWVGLVVGKDWCLPRNILKAILLHHTHEVEQIADTNIRGLVSMLKISNALVSEISLGAYIGEEMKAFLRDGQKDLMLSDEQITGLRKVLISYCHKDTIKRMVS